jgi:hypothetical protein
MRRKSKLMTPVDLMFYYGKVLSWLRKLTNLKIAFKNIVSNITNSNQIHF